VPVACRPCCATPHPLTACVPAFRSAKRTQLLLAAGKRCLQVAAEAGGVALYIDAKNERVVAWYESLGAERLLGSFETMPVPMVMSLKTIDAALKAAGKP
jgi:hypothetical protein